ncbi:MAG: hypothetical protein LBS97_05610 [Treponema sp.]|nr:hypothetical protein [Treponema sp.]
MDNKLEEKINNEISRINKLFDSGKPLLTLCKLKEPDFIEASAAALFLHSFYNGIESIILLIFKSIGEKIPNDLQWHKTLFEQAFEQNDKRTILLRNEYKEQCVEYLSFRHYIRHSYGSEIDWKRLNPLINGAEELWKSIREDIEKFIKNN